MNSTYHSVIRHQFVDRKGFEPRLGSIRGLYGREDALRAEHDHVLLIFARSENLRMAAAAAGGGFNRPPGPEGMTMNTKTLTLESRALFARQISAAVRRGQMFAAKSYGCPHMRFGETPEAAAAKAGADARRVARNAGCAEYPPRVQVFSLLCERIA